MMSKRRGFPMRAVLFGIMLGLSAAVTAAAQLPQSFGNWESRSVQTISIPQLTAAAGNNAAVIREYGFLGGERREYFRQDSKLTVTLWRMEDATGSYGLFTFFGEPGMTGEQMGDDPAAFGPGVFLLQRGPYLLEARGEVLSPAESEELGASVPVLEGREILFPPLPGFLPEEGLVRQSQRYLIGPLAFLRAVDRIPASSIRFEMGAEAVLARYRIEGRVAQLLLVSYPTPQLASKMLREFQSLPSLLNNDTGRTLFIERKGSLVAFVMDAPDLAATEKLLNRISYEADIMWNEYVPPASENAGSLMIAVFSLAGFVLLIAFFSGLAFGGVRLLVKRFVPDAIFDRPANMEIIRLNLTDK
ncbi:MAG: hypothetical protein HY316_06865 [Acidobacteria bacterium]|nr:hypothetical protein [Acidobacteriota bacterium]